MSAPRRNLPSVVEIYLADITLNTWWAQKEFIPIIQRVLGRLSHDSLTDWIKGYSRLQGRFSWIYGMEVTCVLLHLCHRCWKILTHIDPDQNQKYCIRWERPVQAIWLHQSRRLLSAAKQGNGVFVWQGFFYVRLIETTRILVIADNFSRKRLSRCLRARTPALDDDSRVAQTMGNSFSILEFVNDWWLLTQAVINQNKSKRNLV